MANTPRIVTNRAKRRAVKKPAPPALAQRVVTHPSKYERARKKMEETVADPEREAGVDAFFARMIRPGGS